MDKRLLEILACPVTKGPLVYDKAANELISIAARLAYPIRDGIPVMLPEEARKLDEAEAEQLRAQHPAAGHLPVSSPAGNAARSIVVPDDDVAV